MSPPMSPNDRERNRFSARAKRYAKVGTQLSGTAARFAGARFFGVPLDRALELLREQAASEGEATILRALLQRVRGGDALSDAMAEEGVFPEFCVSIGRAGEAGGSDESATKFLHGAQIALVWRAFQ